MVGPALAPSRRVKGQGTLIFSLPVAGSGTSSGTGRPVQVSSCRRKRVSRFPSGAASARRFRAALHLPLSRPLQTEMSRRWMVLGEQGCHSFKSSMLEGLSRAGRRTGSAGRARIGFFILWPDCACQGCAPFHPGLHLDSARRTGRELSLGIRA